MNAKFFDLKQEKQDRMINGALKIFAANGYEHASTDDIVKEACISKGLLFHYFESKLGVYSFAYDYCVKFLIMELSSAIDPGETSYFELLRQIEAAKMQVLRSYPHMLLFLHSCSRENYPEAVLAIEATKNDYETAIETIMKKADMTVFDDKKNVKEIIRMLHYSIDGVMSDSLSEGAFNAEMNYEECINFINLAEKLLLK